MKKIVLKVNGMVCNGCENRVKNAFMNMDGIVKVHADYKKGFVTFFCKKDIDKSVLEKEIVNLGYEVVH